MTDNPGGGGPLGPPWSVDVLADLHAGVLDPELSASLWPRVNSDSEARAVIDALDTVKVELGQLASAPPAPMPTHFAAKLDAALAAEARRGEVRHQPSPPGVAPVVDLAEARRRRNRRMGWGAGVLTAAAAAVAVTVAVLPDSDSTGGNAVAADPPAGQTVPAPESNGRPPLAVQGDDLSGIVSGLNNQFDYGPLKDQSGLDECLRANKIDPSAARTIGVRQGTLDGKPGIFALLTTGELGRFRLLVVEPTCTADRPATLANTLLPGG